MLITIHFVAFKKAGQRLESILIGECCVAGPWTGYVQGFDLVNPDKFQNSYGRPATGDFGSIDQQVRLLSVYAKKQRFLGSAGQTVKINDDRAVTVDHVLQRSFYVTRMVELGEGVAVRNDSIFGDPSIGAPAAARCCCLKRGIQSGSVNAGLASGNDFINQV